MDYEKAYKQALERAKKNWELSNCPSRAMLEEVFPELRESEDERIRKMLISVVKHHADALEKAHEEEMLAWLEKRKEQKPADDNPLDDPRFTEGFDAGRSVQKIFDEPK